MKTLMLMAALGWSLTNALAQVTEMVVVEETLKTVPTYGYVNFNLGSSPVNPSVRQPLTLLGCNTTLTTGHTYWNDTANLQWGVSNQVLPGVPYGWRNDGLSDYYVSKYYMASPPVFVDTSNHQDTVYIGLVLPDRFTFFGHTPVQIVHLDYTILERMYLHFIEINYDYFRWTNDFSCTDLGVDTIPMNIQCADFPWDPQGLQVGGQGASGIAPVTKSNPAVFLPSAKANSDYLTCTLTALDDVMLYHEVYFDTPDGLSKTVSMNAAYEAQGDLNLVCFRRAEPPAGCLPPKE